MEGKILISGGEIHIWYDDKYPSKVKEAGITRRELDRLAVREKLRFLEIGSRVMHDESGAPSLENEEFLTVSISHFRGWYALLLSNRQAGIDIQPYKKALMAGKDYFVNPREKELEYNDRELYLVWAAKEAFYKLKKGRIADLKNEVTITEIKKRQNEIIAAYESGEFRLHYMENEEFVLVYIVC